MSSRRQRGQRQGHENRQEPVRSDYESTWQDQVERNAHNQGEGRGPARFGTDAVHGAQLTCAVPWPNDEKLSGKSNVAIDVEANSWRSEEILRGLMSFADGKAIWAGLL